MSEVTYWTGVWDPEREAVSKEVQHLRASLSPAAHVISFSNGQRGRMWPRRGVFQLSGSQWVKLRALAAMLEPRAAFNHVVGQASAWHLLRALGRRPILFTVAIPGPPLPAAMYAKVSQFVAETEPLVELVVAAGVNRDSVRLIYPGVDLARFHYVPRALAPFRVLFASSPADPAEFEARGVPLLIDAARRTPDIEVELLWRTWGDRTAAEARLRALQPPPNVTIRREDVADMPSVLRSAHIIAFVPADGHGKSCPNSVIEGLASGCPAVVSPGCGVAGLVERTGAGSVVARDPEAIAAAFRNIRSNFDAFSHRARSLAERHFDQCQFVAAYAECYRDLSSSSPRRQKHAAATP